LVVFSDAKFAMLNGFATCWVRNVFCAVLRVLSVFQNCCGR